MAEKQIKVTLRKSVIKSKPEQRKTVVALGLGKISSSVVHNATEPILGMIRTVAHLVEVEEIG